MEIYRAIEQTIGSIFCLLLNEFEIWSYKAFIRVKEMEICKVFSATTCAIQRLGTVPGAGNAQLALEQWVAPWM